MFASCPPPPRYLNVLQGIHMWGTGMSRVDGDISCGDDGGWLKYATKYLKFLIKGNNIYLIDCRKYLGWLRISIASLALAELKIRIRKCEIVTIMFSCVRAYTPLETRHRFVCELCNEHSVAKFYLLVVFRIRLWCQRSERMYTVQYAVRGAH